MKIDLSDTQEMLGEDKMFLSGLGTSCEAKAADKDKSNMTHAEELVCRHHLHPGATTVPTWSRRSTAWPWVSWLLAMNCGGLSNLAVGLH